MQPIEIYEIMVFTDKPILNYSKNLQMRHALKPAQRQLGDVEIGNIKFDVHSRDDIPQLLQGLQYIHNNIEARDAILEQLGSVINEETDPEKGRPGMTLWMVLVLSVLRLGLNSDYDRIMELANEHQTLRQMLGLGLMDEGKRFGLQTIRDNIVKLTPSVLNLINLQIVKQGHQLLGKQEEPLLGRCDSFVLKTNADYPTDAKLLVDAMRKMIIACGRADHAFSEINGWRQFDHLHKGLRNLAHKARKLKPSTSKKETQIQTRKEDIQRGYIALVTRAFDLLDRVNATHKQLKTEAASPTALALIKTIEEFHPHAERQIIQIHERALLGETIPHSKKVFSVFEGHTEWINKGKAGVPVELGIRVCVLEDQMGFILHHQVMEKQTDDKVAISMVTETQANYPQLTGCSFDKGFHSPDNQKKLDIILEQLTLPKKGKWSKSDRERESTEAFVAARKQHPAIESAINALQVHGLDRCPDHGIDAFKRYTALGIVGRNLIKIGAILQQQALQAIQQEKRRRCRLAA